MRYDRGVSNKRPILYRAPHARTPITSRANGKDAGLRTYSRILLHLRNEVPVPFPQKTRADHRNDNNADLTGKVTTKKPRTQTCVGRQIHTPAHAVIAPNDIYSDPAHVSYS